MAPHLRQKRVYGWNEEPLRRSNNDAHEREGASPLLRVRRRQVGGRGPQHEAEDEGVAPPIALGSPPPGQLRHRGKAENEGASGCI